MEMAVCTAEPKFEEKNKKRQKKRGKGSKAYYQACNSCESDALKDSAAPQESPGTMFLNLEPEGGGSLSKASLFRENDDGSKNHSDLNHDEALGTSVLNDTNAKFIEKEKEDEISVSLKAELCSVVGKENCLVSEEPNEKGTDLIKRDDDHTDTINHTAQQSHVNIRRIRKRKRKRKCEQRSLEAAERSLETNMEDGKTVALVSCLHEVETTSHHKNITMETGVLLKDINCTASENAELCSANTKENSLDSADPHLSADGENATLRTKDDHCVKTKDCLVQLNSDETQGLTVRGRKKRRRKSKSNVTAGDPLKCSTDMETTSLQEKMSTTEMVKNVMLKDVSIDCSVSENIDLCFVNTKESPVDFAEPRVSADGEYATMMIKDGDFSMTKDSVAQPKSSDDTHGTTKRKRKRGRKKRKFSDSKDGSLQSDVEDSKKDVPFECLKTIAMASLHENSASTEVVKNTVFEEVSIDCSGCKVPSDIKETVAEGSSSKILEERIKKENVPRVVAYDSVKDDSGAIFQNNSHSLSSNSSKERNAIGCLKKKLLILDVNGLLVDFVPYFPHGYTPDFIISNKAVFKRPFCDDFLQFCFKRFDVAIWSSRTWKNLKKLIDFLMRDSKRKLLFCWDQSHCTTTRFTTIENNKKPLVLKELKKIWEVGEYDESNTLLLDDSPYKALRNPANTAIFPISYQYCNRKDASLGPGGDLRVYLEGLYKAENVQKYVEQNPFGQQPISESNPFWQFYSQIISSKDKR